MTTTSIEYRLLPGTRAAVGRSGAHSVIADRPQAKFGGMGLGFNGGELLALSIGGCFCNDMQAIVDQLGRTIVDLQVSVDVDFAGDPVRASHARLTVGCKLADGSDPSELIELAQGRYHDRQFAERWSSSEHRRQVRRLNTATVRAPASFRLLNKKNGGMLWD